MVQATPAVCQIPISPTETCGIPPIGRCFYCKCAFCLTHQGRSRDDFNQLIPYADVCALCVAKTPAEVERVRLEKSRKERWDAEEYIKSGAARNVLLASGVPSVELYNVESRWEAKKGLFSRGGQMVDVATPVGRGWILGKFMWSYNFGAYEGTNYREECLTALQDKASQGFSTGGLYSKGGLARVELYAGGYKLSSGRSEYFEGWVAAMQAVKRLAGLPTP